MKMAPKSWIIFVIIAMSFTGCMLWPVNEEEVIGIYQSVLENGTPELPDGGSEILELRSDGTCQQKIALKDGRTFAAQGTWVWRPSDSYLSNRITLREIYWAVNDSEQINSDLEKTRGNVTPFLPVSRTLIGRVIIGSEEGSHYEKK